MSQPKLYSYVVEHDNGHAPNPYFGVCTLCRCKFKAGPGKPKNIVDLAEEGDWIVGTGGANLRRSAGHGTLVYAMRVDEKLSREQYYSDRRFAKKKWTDATYAQTQGDNVRPNNGFETHEQSALVSRHFYYFGANAIPIPQRFSALEKKGPGFKKHFDPADINRFVEWLTENHTPGKHGEPCGSQPEGSRRCTSSC